MVTERSERGSETYELLSVTMNDGVKRRSELEGKDNSSEDKGNYKVVCTGDMVYNSMRMWQGANGISPYNGIVSPAYTVLTAKCDISNGFFAALFKTHKLISEFCNHSQGMTSDTWNLKYSQIESIKTYIPSVAEQQKIAALIEKIDKRLATQKELIDSLKKYKRGLNIWLLADIPKNCNTTLGSVCSIVGGGTPDTTENRYWNGDIYWFTPSEVGKTKYVSSSERCISSHGLSKSSAKLLPINAILLTTRATLGEMSILQKEATTNQGFQSLIASNNIIPEYIYYLQVVIKPWCEKYSSGNTFREISKTSLSKCIIPVPEISVQNKIVSTLSKIDEHILTEDIMLKNLLLLKKSLLQQLFI